MTALDAFLYGMPFVLVIGAGVTLWFAKRAAREIQAHQAPRFSTSVVVSTRTRAQRSKADAAA